MTDKGAITQAIEALDIGGFHATARGNIEDVITIMNALQSLKAFKDGLPEGLEFSLKPSAWAEPYSSTEDIFAACEHLLEAIE